MSGKLRADFVSSEKRRDNAIENDAFVGRPAITIIRMVEETMSWSQKGGQK